MPKRRRATRTTAADLAMIPYSTNDGGRWLRKALDPADVDVDIIGMPDTATNSRAVLNYQMQADVSTPDADTFIPTSVSSYDADLYLYQNPIIYGMSASYPQGTKDPSTGRLTVEFTQLKVFCASGTAPRTVNVYMNDQIEGTTYSEKIANFARYCQRYRMIYGGVQAIPACSALFDSGTIEATQQIFNPEVTQTNDAQSGPSGDITNIYELWNSSQIQLGPSNGRIYTFQKFNTNDFPDSGNAIQNPTALYCRYKEGTYMPYKIRNPLVHEYINSEEKTLFEAPYVMTNEAYYSFKTYDGLTNPVTSGILDYDPATRVFSCSSDSVLDAVKDASSIVISIKCYSKLGCAFWLSFSAEAYAAEANVARPAVYVFGQSNTINIDLPDTLPAYSKTQSIFRSGSEITHENHNYTLNMGCELLNAEIGNTISVPQNPPLYLPFRDCNFGVINFRSIGIQASIRLVFRLGFEFMITAGGVYTPFKHKSPRYDQRAIDSYIRTCHSIRDAFLGNAATAEGHMEYMANVGSVLRSLANPGSGWYGRVSI